MKIFGFILGICLFFFFGPCNDDNDFVVGKEFYEISELLSSKYCNSKCGVVAECEGKITTLQGLFLRDYAVFEDQKFFLYDIKKKNYSIEVYFPANLHNEVIDFLKDKDGKVLKVKGIIGGFDMPTNFSCSRGFYLTINEIEDLFLPSS